MNKNNEGISIWQFLTFITFLVLVLSFFFTENKRITIFYVLFIATIIYIAYKICLKNSLSIKNIRKSPSLALPVVKEVISSIFFGIIIATIFSYVLFLNSKENSVLIFFLSTTGWLIFRSYNLKLEFPSKSQSLEVNLFFALILFSLYSYFSKPLYFHSSNIVSFIGSTTLYTKLAAIILSSLVFIEIINFIEYKIAKKSDFTLIKKLNAIKIVAYFVSFFLAALVFTAMMAIIPFIENPAQVQEMNCSTLKTYDLSSGAQIPGFGIFKRTIKDKEFSEIKVVFEGILEKDGDFQEISLLEKLDKKHIQYFQFSVIEDFGFLTFTFHDKNIYYLDSLTIFTLENRCLMSQNSSNS